MKIYYYKQQQNTFELFGKKTPLLRGRYLVAILGMFFLSLILFWRHSHTPIIAPKIVSDTVIAPTLIQPASQNGTPSFDEETQETLLKIKNNIEATQTSTNPKVSTRDKTASLPSGSQVITVKSHDTLGKIFERTSLPQKDLHEVLKSGDEATQLKHLQPGKKLTLMVDNHHTLQQLSYPIDVTDTLVITRENNRFKCQLKSIPMETRQSFAKFTVHGNVLTAAKDAGLSSKRTAALATIFKTSVDINKGSHTGDKIAVLFQDYYADGKKVKDGEIIAAEYKTPTNTYQAVRFTDPKGNSGYYAPDGSSMQKRFLPAPLKFTRITSFFNPNRWHPILHKFRHHKGVDYAAPYGTPIKSVANGIIAHLGRKGGYGNAIIIKHDSSYSTLYGHLSKYATNLKVGSQVKQGQLIGYVGSSGLATGPHLHFEFRINGVHHNPLTVALPNGKSITHAYRNKFHNEVKKLLARLDAFHKENESKG